MAALERERAKGRVFIASDLDTLARQMGVSAEALKAEVAQYNDFCRKGKDDIFLKDPDKLIELHAGDYVAVRCGVDYILTHGGIRINHRMQVQRGDGNVIKGLYAAGADVSGVDSNGYQVALGGHSFGFALTGGRLAAESLLDDMR